MQKLILLGLFLSCFEIQNVLGTSPPPFQDCWDGNKCLLDNQCGINGKCLTMMNAGPPLWPTPIGYVYLQKFKAHLQSYSLDKKETQIVC